MRPPLLIVPLLGLLLSASAAAEPMGWISVPRAHAPALADLELMVEGGTWSDLRAHATAADRDALTALGVPFTLLTDDVRSLRPAGTAARGDASYHTPASMTASLHELAAAYPDLARVVDLGTSREGRELTGVVLTDLPDRRELDEPSWRVLGTHHGDEWSSMEVAWALAWDLADAYGTDPDVTALLDGSEVWVLPVVNPDGVEAFTRRNANNVDVNRNYAYEWTSQSFSGSAPFSEPESDAVRLMAMHRSYGHSMTMHSGATNLGWVWNWSLAPTDDAAVLEAMCVRYLDNTPQPDFWITNGADWYITYGDTNDWSYGARGGHDYTLEISLDKAPPESELQTFLDWHVPASREFMLDGANTGVVGRVTGPEGGVEARLVSDLAPDSPFFSDPETGVFGRPLDPGTHTLTVTAPGFAPATATATVGGVRSGAALTDVTLTPSSSLPLGADGWTVAADEVATITLVGDASNAHLGGGGSFALHRAGLGIHPLAATQGATGAVLTLDPTAIPDAWDRVNEWTLVLLNVGGSAIQQVPLAVAITTPTPTTHVETVTVTDDGATWTVTLDGEVPDGASLRFVGPSGQRVLPIEQPDGASAVLDPSAWDDGPWEVRILGGGEVVSLGGALVATAGDLTADWTPPGDDDDSSGDDDDATGDDDDSSVGDDDDTTVGDDDDATLPPPPPPDGDGCSSCADNSGSGTLALLLLLTPLMGLRRTRNEVRP